MGVTEQTLPCDRERSLSLVPLHPYSTAVPALIYCAFLANFLCCRKHFNNLNWNIVPRMRLTSKGKQVIRQTVFLYHAKILTALSGLAWSSFDDTTLKILNVVTLEISIFIHFPIYLCPTTSLIRKRTGVKKKKNGKYLRNLTRTRVTKMSRICWMRHLPVNWFFTAKGNLFSFMARFLRHSVQYPVKLKMK